MDLLSWARTNSALLAAHFTGFSGSYYPNIFILFFFITVILILYYCFKSSKVWKAKDEDLHRLKSMQNTIN